MRKSKQLKVIKHAKQSRSRVTYQAILDACAHILKSNTARLTTNTIAKKAGVSIGSLYQYFPNKETILGELIEREFELDITLMKNMAQKYKGSSIHCIFDNYLNTASLITQREFDLKQALNVKLTESGKLALASKLQMEFINSLTALFLSAVDWPSKKDARLFSYICFTVTANTFWMVNQFEEYSHLTLKKELLNLFSSYIDTETSDETDW